MYLLAFDPGPHTGVALFEGGRLVEVETLAGATEAVFAGIEGWFGRLARFRTGTVLGEPPMGARVVVEDYLSAGPLSREGKQAIRISGHIQALAVRQALPLTFQSPSTRKPFLDDAMGAVWGLRRSPHSPTPHERDAAAHGLAYLANEQRKAYVS